jgi:tetratricopeptide (TPR) repeat protein
MLNKLFAKTEGHEAETDILQAELALAQKDDDHAKLLFARYLQHEIFACRAKEGVGIVNARAGNMRSAIDYLVQVTLECPKRWKSWNMMGVILARHEKWDASKHAFESALGLSGNAPVVLNNFGYSLLTQKKYSDAEILFSMALEQQPGNVRFQNNLDIARAALGKKPARSDKQSDQRWSERLNNSGYAAILSGHEDVGTALLSEAIIGSSTMASVAAANLEASRAERTTP